jgi:hypothetical protein
MHLHCLLAAALAGCFIAPEPSPTQAAERAAPARAAFPLPAGGIAIAAEGPDGGPTLADVLRDFAQAAGQNVSIDAPTRQALEQAPAGLLRAVEVPAAALYAYVETLLFERGFVVSELRASEPRLLGIYSTRAGGLGCAPARAVPQEEIQLYRDHPALLVSTVLHLPSIDVRQLGNSLRALASERSATTIVPLGATSTLLIKGTGREVAELALMLEQADAAARADLEAHRGSETPPEDDAQPAGDR